MIELSRDASELNTLLGRLHKTLTAVFMVVLVLLFAGSRFVAHSLSRRLDTLRKQIFSVSLENLKANQIEANGADEIGRVASAFQGLLETLEHEKVRALKLEKHAAIAQTTQALAYDVRKPFTMFKMIVDTVEAEEDIEQVKLLLQDSIPEVQQALAAVNGMIADVLEIGSGSVLSKESVCPEALIETSLRETFRLYPDAQVKVEYNLQHKHLVECDVLKVGRIFANIVGNAVQAMKRNGTLIFSTAEVEEEGRRMVRFSIGNTGSFIPPENRSKLFEAFFTSGKKGGDRFGPGHCSKDCFSSWRQNLVCL